MRAQTFTESVYEIVRRIPKGKVSTYSDVAALAGNPQAVRAVGTAMSHNLDPADVPCHRVVGSDGQMRGYAFGGVDSKEKRLRDEGVVMVNGRVDLTKSLWRP